MRRYEVWGEAPEVWFRSYEEAAGFAARVEGAFAIGRGEENVMEYEVEELLALVEAAEQTALAELAAMGAEETEALAW